MREIDGNYILKVNEFGCKKIKGEKFKDNPLFIYTLFLNYFYFTLSFLIIFILLFPSVLIITHKSLIFFVS